MENKNTRCLRRVTPGKLESINPEVYQWWQHIFNILEKDIHMPTEINYTFLREHIPLYLIAELQGAYKLFEQKFSDIPKEQSILHSSKKNMASATLESIVNSDEWAENELTSVQKQLGFAPTVTSNPYLNFFKRRLDRAAIWRELPPLSIADMNLNQLAELLAKNIATEFVTWFSSLGGNESTTVTVPNIIEMFEIGSQVSCATSLRVELMELPCIPDEVAKAKGMLNKSKRKMLYREILNDQRASKQKPRLVAFGKSLPKDMKKKPPPQNIYRKWLQCKNVPEELESMAAVWQGITHLRSTRRFCEYIYTNHPDLKPPKYLLDSGMMYSRELTSLNNSLGGDSFGDVSRMSFN